MSSSAAEWPPDFDHRIASHILTKDQLAAVGSVAIESTVCEQTVDALIWALAGMDESEGRLFTHTMNMQPKLILLGELGKPQLRSKKKLQQFADLISDLKVANGDRNILVHGNWRTDGVGVIRVLAEGAEGHAPPIAEKHSKQGAVTEQRSAARAEAVAKRLAQLTWELETFSRAWRRVPSSDEQLAHILSRSRKDAQRSPKSHSGPRQPGASPE
jgi:hypothetical protein